LSYQTIFLAETDTSVGKETGLTNHMERWNNTLRKRIGGLAKETLSFAKPSNLNLSLLIHINICKSIASE
jgi:insertion element IS1 protein InsB